MCNRLFFIENLYEKFIFSFLTFIYWIKIIQFVEIVIYLKPYIYT